MDKEIIEQPDYTEVRDDRIRTVICKLMSEMLDNPDEHGIYPTSKFMWKMETFILSLLSTPSEPAKAEPVKGCWEDDPEIAELIHGKHAEQPKPVRQDDGEFTTIVRTYATMCLAQSDEWREEHLAECMIQYGDYLGEACDRLDAQAKEIEKLKEQKQSPSRERLEQAIANEYAARTREESYKKDVDRLTARLKELEPKGIQE